MRLQVQIGVECFVVSYNLGDTVDYIAKKSLEKLMRRRSDLIVRKYVEVRKTVGSSLLLPDDEICDILDDDDYISIVADVDEKEEVRVARHREIRKHTRKDLRESDENKRKVSFDFGKNTLPCHYVPNNTNYLTLNGEDLKPIDLVKCERGEYALNLSLISEEKIRKARKLLEDIAKEYKAVYGITTGFGAFATVVVPLDKIKQLQLNLIRSHAVGQGDPLPPNRARMLLALRINILAKGHSGISAENVHKMIAAFNCFCVSFIPQKGTVGCSGDLAPLAHLALGLLGEGQMWSPITGWDAASVVLKKNNLTPLDLGPKEGLALINGTQMVTALGATALERAYSIAKQADVIAALSLDVLKGTTRAFDAESHRHCSKVQDAYTLRCVPQVHGVVHDTIQFVRGIISVEMNSATDNPLIFADREEIISGGNFHGEYPAKALDYLAIAVHELGQMSERRLERLLNPEHSGLPAFLTKDGGVNSGLMAAQIVAASLVSENKVLCHPSSVDSIPTSCNQEDHVSMGGFSSRKSLIVVEHVEAILAMELLAACQAVDFLKPLMSTAPLNKVYQLVRKVSPTINEDRYMQSEIDAVIYLLRENKIWDVVLPYLETLEGMEKEDPDALRHSMETPTGIIKEQAGAPSED